MSRYYTQLECGCLISCDGSGGLISSCSAFDKECKVDEYLKEHVMEGGCCKICNPQGYKEAVEYYKSHPELNNDEEPETEHGDSYGDR